MLITTIVGTILQVSYSVAAEAPSKAAKRVKESQTQNGITTLAKYWTKFLASYFETVSST